MVNRIFSIGTAFAVGAALFFACSSNAIADDSMAKKDVKFVNDAADGGMAEVAASKMAVDKATDPEIKNFAQKMVDDHSKANDELKAAAEKKGITVSTALSSSHQKMVDKLSAQAGSDFDKLYVKDMVSDHKDAVDLFKKEAQNGEDPDLKAWAAQTLPTLQEHLMMIQDIHKRMK